MLYHEIVLSCLVSKNNDVGDLKFPPVNEKDLVQTW